MYWFLNKVSKRRALLTFKVNPLNNVDREKRLARHTKLGTNSAKAIEGNSRIMDIQF